MRVSRYRGEANLKELVGRLYRMDADDPAAAEAAAGLVEANRHLNLSSRTLAKAVDDGALIAVPELGGRFDGRSSVPMPSIASQVVHARAAEVLERIAADEEADDEREFEEVKAVEALLDSPEFKDAAGAPELGVQTEKIRARIDERRERLRTVHDRRGRMIEDARKMADALAARIDASARDR